jgi:hypothetical protein
MMAWLFGSTAVVSTPVPPQPASVEELLSYECAKQIVDLIPIQFQSGPVFYREGVLVSSINTARGEKLLIVNSGSGTFAVPLFGLGVNRVQFRIPDGGADTPIFLSYIHGGSRDSRLFEFSKQRPPPGKQEADYQSTPARRAEDLLPHFEFAVFETLEHMLTNITEKKIVRHDLGLVRTNACDHIRRRSPALARTIRYDLEVIAAVIQGPITPQQRAMRVPASVASALPLAK